MLWLDIETTGLSPERDQILEIGVVLTDDQLVERARRAWIIPFTGEVSSFIHQMHGPIKEGGSGLLDECRAAAQRSGAPGHTRIAEELYAWTKDGLGPDDEKPPLGGSSVHFDRAFVAASPFKHLLGLVAYRNFDVSTIKEAVKRWAPWATYDRPPGPGPAHRALPDLDDTLAEAAHYRARLFANR